MILIGFLLFIVFGILFVVAMRGPVPAKMAILLFLIVGSVSIMVVTAIKGFMPIPICVRHITHLVISPKDLYKPIVVDNFPFYEKGFTKSYLLNPKYLEIYEIGFLAEKADISLKYKFKGKIKAEFFWKDTLLFDKTVTRIDSTGDIKGDMSHYKEISLLTFEIPLQGKYKDDISIKLTVLEPDKELKKYGDSINLYIAVSAVP